jgi:hypothetical protein
VDGPRFDTLIKQFSTSRVTRAHAVRGLAASVAALAGITLTEEPGAAKGDKKDEPQRRVCLWSRTSPGGKTKKVDKDKRKKILRRNDCARKGRCRGTNPCFAPAPECTTDAHCPANEICENTACVAEECSIPEKACPGGDTCLQVGGAHGRCVPIGNCLGDPIVPGQVPNEGQCNDSDDCASCCCTEEHVCVEATFGAVCLRLD